jgi:Ca2+-binding EF-hand superfamily protein
LLVYLQKIKMNKFCINIFIELINLVETSLGGLLVEKIQDVEERHLLTLMQKAFDKANQSNIDTNQMINWLKQELQTQYTPKQKAL